MGFKVPAKPAYCVEFFYAKSHCREALEKSLLQLAEKSRAEDGCLQYELLLDKENPFLFILIVGFSSKETMLLHENQPYIQEFSKNTMNKLCDEVKWYDAFSVMASSNVERG